jgi:uncharacterized protein YjdB
MYANSVVCLEAGIGGNGGTGGIGGNGGSGGNGGNGGTGASGHTTPFGPRGRGGDGGNAGSGGSGGKGGANGSLTPLGIGSSNSHLANSTGGLGGKAGTVGSKGFAGSTLGTPFWGTQGTDGIPGNPGTDRSDTPAINGAPTNLRTTKGTATPSNASMWTAARIIIDSVSKSVYEPNELFDASSLSMRLINAGTTSRTLTAQDVSVLYDFRNTGNTLVTITYDGPTGRLIRYIPVTVNPPTVYRVEVAAPKTAFYVGDDFTYNGISLDVYFTNGNLVTLRSGVNANPPPNMTITAGRYDVPVTFPNSVNYMDRTHSLLPFNPKTYPVDVFSVGLEWLEIIKGPNRGTQIDPFFEGELFDPTGMEFRAHYNNGSNGPVLLDSILFTPSKGAILLEPGTAYPMVALFGIEDANGEGVVTVTFQIAVDKDPIEKDLVVLRKPKQTEYVDGTTFNPEGMELYARRQNSRNFTTEEPLTIGNLNWFRGLLREGMTEIEVTYRIPGGTAVALIPINVVDVRQIGIKVVRPPDNAEYIEGQQFNPTGMIVDRVHNNGSRDENISSYSLSHGVLSLDDSIVTVRDNSHCVSGCDDCKATVGITVREKAVEKLEVVHEPDKTEYEEGESFDPAGMVIRATYDNKDVIDNVIGYEIIPNRPLLIEDTEIIVTFGGQSASIPINVTNIKPTGVMLNSTAMTLLIGNLGFLSATVLPDNAFNKTVIWVSSHPAIASVNEFGIVNALAEGTATITATTEEGDLTASCTVTVITEDTALLSVSSVAALPGKTITVNVDLTNNPGFAGMVLKVSFPKELTLTKYMVGNLDVFSGFTGPDGVLPGAACSISDKFYLVWWRTSNYTEDGTLLTLTFAIDPDAKPGEYPIAVAFEQHDEPRPPVDLQGNPLNIYITNGEAIALSHILGSVTNSGEVGPADLVLLARWIANHNVTINELAADITGNGEIGPADLVMLARWIARHFGSLTIEQVQLWQRDYSHLTLEEVQKLFNPKINEVDIEDTMLFPATQPDHAADAADTMLTVQVDDGPYSPGDTFTANFVLNDNPGFAGMFLKISYPKGIEATSFHLAGVNANMTDFFALADGFLSGPVGYTLGNPVLAEPIPKEFYLVWGRTSDFSTPTATLFSVTFRVTDDAVNGTNPITIAFEGGQGPRDPVNLALQPLTIGIKNGSVTVKNSTNLYTTYTKEATGNIGTIGRVVCDIPDDLDFLDKYALVCDKDIDIEIYYSPKRTENAIAAGQNTYIFAVRLPNGETREDISFSFKPISGDIEKNKTIIYGDVNEDGSITTTDATMVTRWAGGNTMTFMSNFLVADVNGDGSITTTDATLITRRAGGNPVVFPIETRF